MRTKHAAEPRSDAVRLLILKTVPQWMFYRVQNTYLNVAPTLPFQRLLSRETSRYQGK